jgi:succinate dehydrogenase/fumarate reductase flavoprotein subunit
VAKVYPLVSNTQGGLVRDAAHCVLDAEGLPIRRLFAAGEITSVFGHLYLSGGNLAECFAGGRIAGQSAAATEPWTKRDAHRVLTKTERPSVSRRAPQV